MLFDFKTYINLLDSLADKTIQEQDAGSTTASSSTPSAPSPYPTVTKWESGLTRGKANPVNNKEKWTTGIKRGKSNTLL